MYGSENIGISTNGASRDPEGSKIVLYTPIEINGDNSIGVEISKLMDDGYETPVAENPSGGANTYDARPSAIRVIIGKEENKYAGNSTGLNSAGNPFEAEYVEDSVGLYIDKAGLTYRLKDFGFEFGDYARYGKLVYLKAGTLYLDNRETTDINITAGKDNYVFISDTVNSDLTVNPNLNIGTEAKVPYHFAVIFEWLIVLWFFLVHFCIHNSSKMIFLLLDKSKWHDVTISSGKINGNPRIIWVINL